MRVVSTASISSNKLSPCSDRALRLRAEARSVDERLPTVMTKNRLAVCVPFITPHFDERDGQQPRVHAIDDPLPAVTSHGAGALVKPDTSWQVGFRQGGPRDAELLRDLFGQTWSVDETWSSDGRVTKRQVQRWRVDTDEWMNHLEPGDGWLRVAPVDRRWRQERIRVALPKVTRPLPATSERGIVRVQPRLHHSDTKADAARVVYPEDVAETGERVSALPAVPRTVPRSCSRRWGWMSSRRWSGAGQSSITTWARTWSGARASPFIRRRVACTGASTTRSRKATMHRVVWRRVYGPIPRGLEVDHLCEITLCQRPDHLDLVTKGENGRRRHQRTRTS
jgi:hypothetical protein